MTDPPPTPTATSVAMLFASGVHPTGRRLGPTGERCATCPTWTEKCGAAGVQAAWRACSSFVRAAEGVDRG